MTIISLSTDYRENVCRLEAIETDTSLRLRHRFDGPYHDWVIQYITLTPDEEEALCQLLLDRRLQRSLTRPTDHDRFPPPKQTYDTTRLLHRIRYHSKENPEGD